MSTDAVNRLLGFRVVLSEQEGLVDDYRFKGVGQRLKIDQT